MMYVNIIFFYEGYLGLLYSLRKEDDIFYIDVSLLFYKMNKMGYLAKHLHPFNFYQRKRIIYFSSFLI
jgi:hypothetical protein